MTDDGQPTPPLLAISVSPLTGRSYRTTQDLAPNSCVLDVATPYSCTIYKQFRNEVCAECWRYECGRRDFLTCRDVGQGAGLSFCDAECRDAWVRREGEDTIWFLQTLETARRRNEKGKSPIASPASQEITAEIVAHAWEEVRAQQSRPKTLKKWKQIQLDDFETDLARYVLIALIHLHRESDSSCELDPVAQFGASWADFSALQSGELQHIKRFPELLQNHIRIYQVLRSRFVPDESPSDRSATSETPTSVRNLGDVITTENVRTTLAMDPGNSFGIWQVPVTEESEGLGFGVYPVPSFFNHNCSPNVHKDRQGRRLRFVTTREISAGEELCISYGHVEDMPLKERRVHLLEGWFFVCHCSRCVQEDGRSQE